MIDKYVNDLSQSLVTRYPEELPPYGITRYGLKFIITNILPITLLLLVGLMLNNYNNVLISILSFSLLRMTSGGYHSKYPEICMIYSTTIILSIASLGSHFEGFEWIISGIALILVTKFAPSNIDNQTKILKKYFKYLKYISILTVIVGSLFQNPIVSCSMLAQSLLLIRLKGGEKND
ncbi:accessory gene regulator B family protein [Paenibacillus sp. NPDC057886]|uniref:accessory gene regulator B family protein n=1 Tax=Paenibacillus sp. NPDC057886 TaxID=3346270 RepID=UPI0036BDBCF6